MKSLTKHLIVAAVTLLAAPAFAQWTQPAGTYYAKVQGNFMSGSSGFNLDDETFSVEDFSVIGLGLYAEYGFAPGRTLTLNSSPLSSASYGDESTLVSGPTTVGLREQLYQSGPVALASEGRIGIDPGGGDKNLAGADDTFIFLPSRGFGARFEGVLQFGLGFEWVYLSSEFGARFNWYDDTDFDLIGNLQLGVNLPYGFTPLVFSTFNWNLSELEVINVAGATQTRYIGLGLGLGWWPIERFGITLSTSSVLYAASNAGAPVMSIGLQFR